MQTNILKDHQTTMTETFFVTMLYVRKFWVNVFFLFFCRFAPLILL